MRGYKPEELFTQDGQLIPELKDLAPKGHRRMSANPVAIYEAGKKVAWGIFSWRWMKAIALATSDLKMLTLHRPKKIAVLIES